MLPQAVPMMYGANNVKEMSFTISTFIVNSQMPLLSIAQKPLYQTLFLFLAREVIVKLTLWMKANSPIVIIAFIVISLN